MKKEIFILLIVMMVVSGCHNYELTKIHWSPPSDAAYAGDLKMILVLKGDLAKVEKSSVLAKITDEKKVYRIYDALDDARYFCRSYDFFTPRVNQKAICFIDTNDYGCMIRIDWDEEEKKVTFAGGYSDNLYKVLTEYGVIEPEKRPDVELFSSDPELAKIEFVPMPEYAGRHGNLKKVVFLEGDHFDFIFRRTENWHQLAEVTDLKEIEKIKQVFSTGKYCIFHLLERTLIETAIGFIYEDGWGELLRIDPNIEDQTVEFQGGYSKELYEILVTHGIIKPDK